MNRFRTSISDDSTETSVDISPLIDCVFILLIFFIVTTTFVEETGVEVQKPQAATASQLDKNSILLAITSKGEVVYDKKDIGVGGVQPLVRMLLQREKVPVIVQADTNAQSGLLVRVVDAAYAAGAESVNIATQPGRS